MPERTLRPVADAAAAMLGSTAELLESLADDVYVRPSPACQNATIGQHVRHLTDHVSALVRGHEGDAAVCYDRRDRGTEIETDRGAAVRALRELHGRVAGLDDTQLNFTLRVVVLPEAGGEEVELESNVARELAFVTHHAVHHLAVIRVIAGDIGVDLPPDLGRAPATIQADNA